MNGEANRPPQISLLLRLLGGGYLVYLAWDLMPSAGDSLLFLTAAVVFGLAGAVLFGHSLLTLLRHGYFRKDPVPEIETTEDCEERSDD